METHNRWRIAIETERTLIVLRRSAKYGCCERCGREVELVAARSAEQVLGMSLAQMERQAPSTFHLTQAKEGLAICLKSLLRFFQSAVIEDTPGNQA
jgi:hypothetical protein